MGSGWLGVLLGACTAAYAAGGCGERVTLPTHDGSSMPYSLALPPAGAPQGARVALVLLAGGGGHVDLDEQGCARKLKGNSLVRSVPHFLAAGFATALVDATSDHTGEDGLGGFRIERAHAEDLGRVIADVRRRTGAAVWLAGSSRGSISAVNAAAHLAGPSAPDGIVLQSALMSGFRGGRKLWVAHTVFDLPLERIRVPVLIIGHAADKCSRSPPTLMPDLAARLAGARKQIVTVTGGPGWTGAVGTDACIGRAPHGFADQEAEVAAGIVRFIRGAAY